MQHPPVSLENLSEEEKNVLVEHARKGIVRGAIFFLTPFFVFGFLMFYVNNHYMDLGLDKQENLRATINVLLVVLTILPARLFVNTVLRFRKANNAWQKKVFRGTVTNKEGRTIFIGLGAAVIANFGWVFYLFGLFLVWTAVKVAREGETDEEDYTPPLLLRIVQKRLPATEDYRGVRLTVVEGGRRLVTPMLIVLVALGATDLLFAFDSIPAIFGLTREPYLVLMANLFALMGLRQLYFLIGGLLTRLCIHGGNHSRWLR